MSGATWGLKHNRIRCCKQMPGTYLQPSTYMEFPRLCRKPAVAAVVFYPYKNGHSTRPYPVCRKHQKAKWHWRKQYRPMQAVSLEVYREWLEGRRTVGYKRRRVKKGGDSK